MDAKFAVLEYASCYDELISNKTILKIGNKALRSMYIRKRLPYTADEISVLGVNGLKVTLPLTEEDATNDESLKTLVYHGVLEKLRLMGVRAVKACSDYRYDSLLPAASGFYILPFLLPLFLKKSAKILNKPMSGLEVLTIDGISDLSIDILFAIADEINHITVYTDKTEFFQRAAYGFLCDSGLNISLTDNRADASLSSADVILCASRSESGMESRFKRGAVFFEMTGNKKWLSEVSKRRPDIISANGIELKKDGSYINNVLLEAILLASSKAFRRYVFGGCDDNDFYSILEYVERQDFLLTTFLREGRKALQS